MSNEDEYTAHRRRLREEHGLPPVEDGEEVTFIDLPGGGFLGSDGTFGFVVGGDSEQPEAGRDDWPDHNGPGRRPMPRRQI